ncbi:hypothetical protein [Citricoccus sp.]|uniref:hypothetical protein n=1 Tax=Citricoccus sp. TaxID=1978372 RepID=UPI0028BE95D3|nr:hypothetical protein [Citricoccus sp.]
MRAENLQTDSACRDLIDRWATGHLSERQARQEIAGVLTGSGISHEVSREYQTWHYGLASGPQLSQDVAAEFDEFLFRRVTEEGPEAFFDLERARGASVTGWARQTLRATRKSVLRNIHNRTAARQELVAPTGAEEGRHTAAAHAFTQASAPGVGVEGTEVAQRMMLEEATEWLRSKASHHRGIARTAAGSAALRFAFNLPEPVRPEVRIRRRALPLLESDPKAAHRSAQAMLACLNRIHGWQGMFAAADQDLLALWDDYSKAQLFELVSRDPAIAHTLAVEALADRARPDRPSVRAFRAAVKEFAPVLKNGRKPAGWRTCVNAVVDAFLAEEFEAFSAFDTAGAATHEDKLAEREQTLAGAWDAYQAMVRFPEAPLGTTHREVRDRLDGLIRGILGAGVEIGGSAAGVSSGTPGTTPAGSLTTECHLRAV